MEIRDYLMVLRRSWLVIVVLAVVGAGVGLGYSALRTPTYAATAQVYVSVRTADTLGDAAAGVTYAQQAAAGYANIATTAYVLKPVIVDLGLAIDPATLAARVSVTPSDTTPVLAITATDTHSTQAVRIANAVAQQLSVAANKLTPDAATARRPAAAGTKLTVVNPAVAPAAASGPSRLLVVGGGALAGLLIGLLVGVLRELFNTRVRTVEDLERVTDLPVVGTTRRDVELRRHPLAVLQNRRSPRAEAYRTLRTNLRYVELDEIERSLVVTSSVEGEGKSTTAANLALAAASLGQKVLLVDADLRRPAIGSLFGVEDAVGLSQVLIKEVELEQAVQSVADSGLDVLPAGAVPPNPNELLQSRAMADLLTRLHAAYDLVVFDTPPLLPVSDATVLGVQAGGVLVVVSSGRVRRAQLSAALQSLKRVNSRVVGVVVTMLPRRGPDAYGYGYGISESRGRKSGGGTQLEPRNA